jgi:hypothetical protein
MENDMTMAAGMARACPARRQKGRTGTAWLYGAFPPWSAKAARTMEDRTSPTTAPAVAEERLIVRSSSAVPRSIVDLRAGTHRCRLRGHGMAGGLA